jgi:1-acyl-sn-glycerol-3-phosphate acyltransferase
MISRLLYARTSAHRIANQVKIQLPDNLKSTVKVFIRNLRGVAYFGVLTANTIFWFVPIIILAIFKLLLPAPTIRRAITRTLMAIGENWVSINWLLMRTAGTVKLESRGLEDIRRDGWYLVMANHQTWVDIVVLQAAFNRRAPFLKFFIKQELIWFPLLGIAWWAMDMPFMKRYSPSFLAKNPHMKGKDLETTRRACEKFRDTPTSILNFVEGTRFSEEKRTIRKSPYNNLLQPRAGGFAVALSSMGKLFTSVVDVTLIYPDCATSFWDMCCGDEVHVIVDARERDLEQWLVDGDYQTDREFRRKLHAWLSEVWTEKDEMIAKTRESHGR